MTALTRFERFDNLFPEMMRRWARSFPPMDDAPLPSDIRIDVNESDKEYVVSAEIPGAKKEDIHVSIDGNYVSISAEIKKEKEDKRGRTLVRETYHGSASRGFTLATDVDEKSAVAKLENGVLQLTLPKRQGAASHALKIE